MADARLAKARDTLPIGYQFGDGEWLHNGSTADPKHLRFRRDAFTLVFVPPVDSPTVIEGVGYFRYTPHNR